MILHETNIRTLQKGMTALHWLAGDGYIDGVKILLEAGADVHLTDAVCRGPWNGDIQRTFAMLHVILLVSHAYQLLRSVGETPNQIIKSDLSRFVLQWGQTALHHAIGSGQLEICKLLVNAGLDVNQRDGAVCVPTPGLI